MNLFAGSMTVSSGTMRFMLILSLIVSVASTAYVVYQVNIPTTPQQSLNVTFWNWEHSNKEDAIDYSARIYPDAKTIIENISYGIFCDDNIAYECSIRINLVTNLFNIGELKIIIYNLTDVILTKAWSDFSWIPTSWESFRVSANTKYSIWIEITGSSSGTPDSSSVIRLDLSIHYP